MMEESSSSSTSSFHSNEDSEERKPLSVCVTTSSSSDDATRIITGAASEYHSSLTPTPQNAAIEKESCFWKLDLLRKCIVGGEGGQPNLLQSPTSTTPTTMGQQSSSFSVLPSAATPLHEETTSTQDDENSMPSTQSATVTPSHESCASFSSAPTSRNSYAIRRSPTSISVLPLQGLHRSSEQRWEELEDDLLIRLNGRLDHVTLFHKLYAIDGIQNAHLLQSIAYLSTFRRGPTESDESTYYEYISALASYLSVGRAKRERKLAVIQTLMTCLSPAEASWQIRDAIIEGTLDFITCRTNEEWEFMEHTETMLIWELRAMSLRLLDRERERVALVTKTGDTAAIVISAGAWLVEEGMTRSGIALSSQIEQAGVQVKGHIKANDYPLMMDRDAVVALTFADAAKRASSGAKESTKLAMHGIRDASSRGIHMVASKFEEGKMGEHLPPEGREALKAVGKVGLATVGAAAIVGEAIYETSRLVMEKTGKVASDVVEHKYGASAGKVASDANETTSNIMRAFGDVARVSGTTTMAKAVATGEAKDLAILEAEKAKEAIRRFESRATSLLKNTIENGSRWIVTSPAGLLLSSSRGSLPAIAGHSSAQENVAPSTPARRLFTDAMPKSTSSHAPPDLAPSSSMDSESSSSTSLRRTCSSEEDNNSSYLSSTTATHQSLPSTRTSVTIASRRSSSSQQQRSFKCPLTPNPRRKSNSHRCSTSKRRGTGKRVPLTPDLA